MSVRPRKGIISLFVVRGSWFVVGCWLWLLVVGLFVVGRLLSVRFLILFRKKLRKTNEPRTTDHGPTLTARGLQSTRSVLWRQLFLRPLVRGTRCRAKPSD